MKVLGSGYGGVELKASESFEDVLKTKSCTTWATILVNVWIGFTIILEWRSHVGVEEIT